jgi:hypothetical protein
MVGQWVAPHLPERRRRQGFSALLVSSALLTGIEAWRRQPLPPDVISARPAEVPPVPRTTRRLQP